MIRFFKRLFGNRPDSSNFYSRPRSGKRRSKSNRRVGVGFERLGRRDLLAGLTGDFNGDGYDDLAIGVPGEDVSGIVDAGAVNVIYGGPTAALHNVGDQFWTQDSTDVENSSEAGDAFGAALAVGDFNGDGRDDLAIGVPGEDWNSTRDAGAVNILYGSQKWGLQAFGDQVWSQATDGILDTVEAGDAFASSLSAGDFNGDGYDDLAIGVPGEDWNGIKDAGAIAVIYGGPTAGLHNVGDQIFTQDSNDIEGTAEAYDNFGATLASGDFNGDRRDDLAIGVPNEDWNTIQDAGAINVLYGSQKWGLQGFGDQVWSQATDGILEDAEKGDLFGHSLAVGDFNGDHYSDLSIGAPSEDLGNISDAGAVHVIYGGPTAGLHNVGDQVFTQNTNGVHDTAEKGDWFGAELLAADFNGNGIDDLAIGVPLEGVKASQTTSPSGGCQDNPATPYNDCPLTGSIGANFDPSAQQDDEGAVHVLYGSQKWGVQTDGASFWEQDKYDVADQAEKGDRFGASLTAGDFNGDGRMDLVIGIPGEDIGTVKDAGAVYVMYGSQKWGVQTTGSQFWNQDTDGILDVAQLNDGLGARW